MSTPLNGKLVTVFGGSGFLGRHIVQALSKRGYRVRAAVRRPDLANHLQPLGAPGQIMAVQANLRYRWSVDRAVQGADAVVNAVGILSPNRQTEFRCGSGLRAPRHRRGGPCGRTERHYPHFSNWRGSREPICLCPVQSRRRSRCSGNPSQQHHPAALDRLWAGRQFLQPVCKDGPNFSGPTAGWRRRDQIPAGLCL
jgi:hypothetical protein